MFARAATALLLITLLLFGVVETANAKEFGSLCQDQPAFCQQLPYPVYFWNSRHNAPHAVVVLIHGFAMHGRTFETLANYLAERGFASVAIDMQGYGERRTDLNSGVSRREAIDYKRSLSDYQLLIKRVHESYPSLAVFVVGESLGASMAIRVAATSPEIAGIVLSSPALRLRKSVSVENLPCVLAHVAIPSRSVNLSRCIRKLVADQSEIQDEVAADRLIRRRFGTRDIYRTLSFMHRTIRFCRSVPTSVPCCMLESSDDTLLSGCGAYKILKALGSTEKNFRMFNEKAHILLETNCVRPDVLDAVYRWIDERVEHTKVGQSFHNG